MFLIAVFVAVVLWAIGGGVAYHTSGASSAPAAGTTGGRCDQCVRLHAWWASLDWVAKIGAGAWYVLQAAACKLIGC